MTVEKYYAADGFAVLIIIIFVCRRKPARCQSVSGYVNIVEKQSLSLHHQSIKLI